jgi:magnesium transporter
MRKISAWVGVGAVPTMVAGIYGINFENLPELQWKYGYYVVLGALAAVSAGFFRVFRRNTGSRSPSGIGQSDSQHR